MRLKELRIKEKLTQADVAKIINVAQTTYTGYELEKYEPTIQTLKNLANYYNVSLDYLIGRDFNNGIGYIKDKEKELLNMTQQLNEKDIESIIAFTAGLTKGKKQYENTYNRFNN